MASQAEIIQIANSFLLHSPPGEFMEVVTDVRGLLGNQDHLINSTAIQTFGKWNTDQMLQVVSPNGGHQVLITKYGEVSESEYVDPRGKCVLKFDHIKQQLQSHRALGGELDNDVEPYRSAIDDAIHNYSGEHYINGGSTVYGSKDGGNHNVTICISASKFKPSNFWNGRWRSVWVCTFKPNGEVKLEGTIRVNVHYYEDGNVQLSTSTKKKASCQGGNAATTAANIAKVIAKAETEFHNSLEQSYNTMGETTFKALRRVLPITRQKIDWNKIRNMRVGQEIGAR
jgi:capping protein alpha